MNEVLLETNMLTKNYGNVCAVKNFTVKLDCNKIYGFLGRNGAGKTTFLNIISSRIFADSGQVKLFGRDKFDSQEILSRISYMPEKNLFIDTMRVSEILESAALFYDSFDMQYAQELCIKFNLQTRKKYKSLSRGYESILRIVIGLASRTALTMFDEPVLGLDAAVRDMFYKELIEDYTNHPRSFIISTHLIEESADVFEEVVIIKEGSLVEQLPVDELKEMAQYVSGKAASVDEAIAGLKVIHSETVGATKICAIFDKLDDEKLKKLSSYNLDITPIPVQKLFIYLTNNY